MNLTYLDSNSWLIEIEDQRILLDPWLVGPLVFGNQPWLFKSERTKPRAIPEAIDLILLSQGLEDHAHRPTLEKLDRHIPVVASPNAAKVVRELGYTQITSLAHHETFNLKEKLEIKAVPGSPIGPQLVENGYIIKELQNNRTLYYEPHGFHSPSLAKDAPIDIVITPIIDIKLLFAPVIKGQKSALEACKLLKAKTILPTAGGGDVVFEGLLNSLLRVSGTIADFRSLLAQNNLDTRVIDPVPGEALTI
jgi:L-ascorbate metabolism protein UlaG (beta-lactamase superfamily)